MGKAVQLKRRNLLKGLLATGAVGAASSHGKSHQGSAKDKASVRRIRPGYFCVNGVVVTAAELRTLQEGGLC